jgi:hypothetical protein
MNHVGGKMYLKFVGKDGSMGLTHGKVYNVKIESDRRYIWVYWGDKRCPYSSPQSFADNWM